MARLSETTKYTLYGASFGLCFPIVSIGFLYFMNAISDTSDLIATIAAAHQNILLYVIDSAPLFLGLFARLAGMPDRILHFSTSSNNRSPKNWSLAWTYQKSE
jgi:hypothetical protein